MMAEDETKKDAVEETAQDEGAAAAGPDATAEESSPAGEDEAAEAPAEEADAPASEEDDLPWKERRRLAKSRKPHEAKPQLSVEERVAEREAQRKRKAEGRRKERAAAKGEKSKGTGTPVASRDANAAKVRQGVVTSDKGDKTIVVRIDLVRRHPTYEKVIRRSRTLHAHDERNEAGEGDTVRVVETRPMSKTKRWRLVEVLEKAK